MAAKAGGRFICPACFVTFPASALDPKYPMCPHCDSEGIGSEVVPVARLLEEHSTKEIEGWVAEWRAAAGFYPAYHSEKLKRLESLLARSRRLRRERS